MINVYPLEIGLFYFLIYVYETRKFYKLIIEYVEVEIVECFVLKDSFLQKYSKDILYI